eukprot:818560-Amphidinium_carterae.1
MRPSTLPAKNSERCAAQCWHFTKEAQRVELHGVHPIPHEDPLSFKDGMLGAGQRSPGRKGELRGLCGYEEAGANWVFLWMQTSLRQHAWMCSLSMLPSSQVCLWRHRSSHGLDPLFRLPWMTVLH